MAESDEEKKGPLSHIRVLDLGRIMAAPWASQIFADLGAEVIKVERPGTGDDTRAWGPPYLRDAAGETTSEAGYFLAVNRGKRSITLDISKPEGQAVVRRLALSADIVIENFRPGTLDRYGLGAASLRALKPSLVYCSVSGFGQDGPRRDQTAYDFAIQAMGGLMSVTGERDACAGAGPQKVGVPIIDLMTGMYAAVAALASLVRRAERGAGDTIDIAMLDVATALLSNQAMNYLVSGNIPARAGNRHPNIQPQDIFSAADGDFALAVGNDQQFARLCTIIGRGHLASDTRFATNSARVRNQPQLHRILRCEFGRFPRVTLMEKLQDEGVPAGSVNSIAELFADPQITHREMVRQLPHPLAGTVPQVVSPLRFAEAPLSFERAPPTLGQDTGDLLFELGFDADAQASLRAAGIV